MYMKGSNGIRRNYLMSYSKRVYYPILIKKKNMFILPEYYLKKMTFL